MGFRFRKRIKIAPGISVNLSKSGISTTIGKKGCSINIGKKRKSYSLGIPGTGISYSGSLVKKKSATQLPKINYEEMSFIAKLAAIANTFIDLILAGVKLIVPLTILYLLVKFVWHSLS